MLTDARSLPEGREIEADLCILGGGAAGIALAREFVDRPTSVCLVESGGLNPSLDVQSLYRGELTGTDYHALDRCRLRYFGGTTNHWGGTCRPLDEIDFQPREWVAHSGWPISRSELVPFYSRAQTLCELGPFAYELGDWDPSEREPLALAGGVETRLFQHSPPTRFGSKYRNSLWRADNLQILLNANAVELETSSDGRSIERVRVATLSGTTLRVTAQRFLLCLGAIENSRLLLASGGSESPGLGNGHDQVGRYFMDHPYVIPAAAVVTRGRFSPELYDRFALDGTQLSAFLTLSNEIQREDRLLNFGMTLIRRGQADATRTLGQVTSELRRGDWPDDFADRLGLVLSNLDEVASDFYRELRDEDTFHVMHWMETTPNPDNRVALSDERDELGMRRVRLHWKISPADIASMRRAYARIARELGRSGIGRMRIDFEDGDRSWGPSLGWGCHHIGTTRMHSDPRHGVVDADGKVHELDNLFVAGSSVFPTAGASNPTLTIVALALRLADHLKGAPNE